MLLDTHILAWIVANDSRLPAPIREQIVLADHLAISAVTAWEFADLWQRGRLANVAAFEIVVDALALKILDTPAGLWKLAATLPDLHRDPVDRMLIAHAIHADLTLITADETMRRYPVRSLW